jgi:hypothetical protein
MPAAIRTFWAKILKFYLNILAEFSEISIWPSHLYSGVLTRFPEWFGQDEPETAGNSSVPDARLKWADSNDNDDLPDLPFQIKTEDTGTPNLRPGCQLRTI